jgi:hypothetical protein
VENEDALTAYWKITTLPDSTAWLVLFRSVAVRVKFWLIGTQALEALRPRVVGKDANAGAEIPRIISTPTVATRILPRKSLDLPEEEIEEEHDRGG